MQLPHVRHALFEVLCKLGLVVVDVVVICLLHAVEVPRQLVDFDAEVLHCRVVFIGLLRDGGHGHEAPPGQGRDEEDDGDEVQPSDDLRHGGHRRALAARCRLEDDEALVRRERGAGHTRADVADGRLGQGLAVVRREVACHVESDADASQGRHVQEAQPKSLEEPEVQLCAHTANIAELVDAGAPYRPPLSILRGARVPEVLQGLVEIRLVLGVLHGLLHLLRHLCRALPVHSILLRRALLLIIVTLLLAHFCPKDDQGDAQTDQTRASDTKDPDLLELRVAVEVNT
mmetsp:Transcript_89292/g.288625  ORF Transcript_89292/g.288625 Transcript_89292/m.288625 type:complete len:288 (-) Transcript_89292:229-1092(-)